MLLWIDVNRMQESESATIDSSLKAEAPQPVIASQAVVEYAPRSTRSVLSAVSARLFRRIGWLTALMLLAMLIPFSLVVLKRALAIQSLQALAFCAVKFDCGCGTGEVYICHKLVENGGLILLSAWLLAGKGRQLCLRYGLVKENKSEIAVRDAFTGGAS